MPDRKLAVVSTVRCSGEGAIYYMLSPVSGTMKTAGHRPCVDSQSWTQYEMPPKVDLHPPDLGLPEDATKFPTNRLPQLNVPIVKRFPEEFLSNDGNHSEEEDRPSPVVPEKTMYNIWEQTQTQMEVRWNKPENAESFASLFYEIQIREGDSDWVDLAENRLPLYRVYFAEGKAFFGRIKINQKDSTHLVRLRIRPVGVINKNGKEEQRRGPWSQNILFSIEAK